MKNITKKKKNLTREEAIKKLGKYAVVTTLGTFMLLSPQAAQASSPAAPGEGFWGRGF
jgi:hypothetical protein